MLSVRAASAAFDYLRGVEGTAEAVKAVKAWIVDENRKGVAAAA